MKVEIYGRTVDVPELIELPLKPSAGEIDLTVSLGEIEDPEHSFPLDDAVVIHLGERCASVEPLKEIGPRALEHYLVDHAIPCGLTHLGDVVVHGAGLFLNGRGILLLGESGRGKSTLAMHLAAAGWALLGDDSIRVEVARDHVTAFPSYPGFRLFDDSLELSGLESGPLVSEYASKRRTFLEEDQVEAPIELVVELGDDAPLRVRELGPAQRCAALANQVFFAPGRPHDAMQRFDLLAPFAGALNGVRVEYQRNPKSTAAFVGLLEQWSFSGETTWPNSLS